MLDFKSSLYPLCKNIDSQNEERELGMKIIVTDYFINLWVSITI